MSAPYYVHAIDGRLRIKVPVIKGSDANAACVASGLHTLGGIRHLKVNPTTANVLVLFDPLVVTQREIIAKLKEMNCFDPANKRRSTRPPLFTTRIIETVVQSAVQVALERVILALV